MKPTTFPGTLAGYCMIFCLQAVHGVEIPKLFNNISLNLPGSWSGGVVPGATDVALWNELFPSPVTTTGALSPLGADLSFSGIKVTAVGGTRNAATNYIGFHNPSSTNTLTIGAAGFDLSTATQTFYGSSKILIGADQSWNIGNANTNGNPAGNNNNEDLIFQAQAAGAPFNFGGRRVTTTGTGQVTITSGYTLQNGTLDVGNNLFVIQGGSNRNTTLNANLNLVVSAGALRLQSNSGVGLLSLTSAAPITVNGGAIEFRTNNNATSLSQTGSITLKQGATMGFIADSTAPLTISGAVIVDGAVTFRTSGTNSAVNGNAIQGNLSGAGNISYLNNGTGATNQINLTGDNSSYTGIFSVDGATNNRRLRISSATGGSAAATWNIATANTLEVQGVSIQLGTLTGAGTVTNSSTAAQAVLNVGAGNFSGIISDGTSQLTSLNKVGPGQLNLTGSNTYSGLTTVAAGKLTLSTSQSSTTPGNISVADGATFAVAQTAPDTTLQVGNLTLGSTSGATLEIALGSQLNPSFAPLFANNLLVNGPNILRVSGSNLSVGNFPVIEYGTVGGTDGLSGLALKLPARTTGTLSNSAGAIRVDITQSQQIKWVGNISENWDIDPDGTQTAGTPNWKTTVTDVATRYLQGSGGTDVVNFDDSATGTGTVNLTTTLSPVGILVNSSKAYTFTGPGKLTGSTGLLKSGSGTLTIANTGANDYLGTTTISAGILRLGDGVTVGAGIISGAIVNDGRLVLDRPADHVFTNPLTGNGTIEKAAPNAVTFGAVSFFNPIVLTDGKLLFNGGGNLGGPISGPGQLESAGGTLTIEGADANTNTGLVTVSAGALRLSKAPDTNAVGGDITIQDTGTLAIINSEQIPDTATINVKGTSNDSFINSTGVETFANAILSGATPDTQIVLRNFPVITGTGTVNQGVLGVASGHTATVNSVVMTSSTAILRVAGNTAGSVLNVGSGGITASAGEIQVKFNGNAQDAVLNLEGGLTATGNLTISNGAYAGPSLNVINLLEGAHAFTIAAGTTTTVAPDFGGPGSLVKSGAGTLSLGVNSTAAHTGGTTVSAGALLVNGALQGTTTVSAAGTIGGSGLLEGTTTVQGTVAPGETTGKLTTTAPITLAAGSTLAIDIANWAGTTAGTDYDLLAANTLTLEATIGSKLLLKIAGSPSDFTESAKTLVIATSVNPLTGFNPAAVTIDKSAFTGSGTFSVQQSGNAIELVYAAGTGTPYSAWAAANGLDGTNNIPSFDADKDGAVNFVEFALNSLPLSPVSSGKSLVKVAAVGGEQALTLTVPVRSAAPFSGATEQMLTVDGLVYRIQGSDTLGVWNLAVSEVTGADATAIQTSLPALQTGWFYRTFRSPGPVSGDPMDFLRLQIEFAN